MQEHRKSRTPDQVVADNLALKGRMTKLRKERKTKVQKGDALRSEEILSCSLLIAPLHESDDCIGDMNHKCTHCGALKFRKETSSTCCLNGQVVLDPFPKPPPELLKLWTGKDTQSKVFRENSRQLNNSVCLTSVQVNERRGGYTPSVIFQGRVHHRIGAIANVEGETPRYAQLYVLDPALEETQRFNNMEIPRNISNSHKNILKELLLIAQQSLHANNPFIQDFKQIIELPVDEVLNGRIVISAKAPNNEHERRYNLQTNLQEVSIVTNSEPHDLVLHLRGGGLQTVDDLNPKGMPLHFTLLFPFGTHGWNQHTMHIDGKRRVTTREFYAYHLNIRQGDNEDYLMMASRLFQEWICMAYVSVENQRLNYQKQHQKELRADSYKNVQEAVDERRAELAPREDGLFQDDHQRPTIGRKILSSSFTGSPRWYNGKFQDGMAIVRTYHKPDLFITMTCNPKWPEITKHLLQGQSPQDRPDVVAKAFKMKKDQLMKDLVTGEAFGKVVAYMNVIEFQKRGLPHCHILIILADNERLQTSDSVNKAVTAELPPNPVSIDDEDGRVQAKRLQDLVMASMVHGPCGKENPSAPCMENGKCSKNFPKGFQKKTVVDTESSYPTYRRRAPEDGGRVLRNEKNRIVDNRWVIPYNPMLSARYECHINVEVCASAKATKYLFKYVTKGNDRALVRTEVEGQPRDEIQEYQDLRSVGSMEGTWHLMNFDITERYPAVMALKIHLENQQQVVFDHDQEIEAMEAQRQTELTAFFDFNSGRLEDGDSPDELPKYADMPKKNVYDKKTKKWRGRKRGVDTVIGRVHTVNPIAGDVYYLRILLHDDFCRGKTSFQDMLTLQDGTVKETYKAVCLELGLLSDNSEWRRALEESAITATSPQLRELYIIILMFCMPSNPRELFDEFFLSWADDFERKAMRQGKVIDDGQKRTMVLLDLEVRLQSFEKGLLDFGLPVPTPEELALVETITSIQPVVIREELQYEVEDLMHMVEERVSSFTPEQEQVFNYVMESLRSDTPVQVFIDARGGTGKTYTLNAILAAGRTLKPGGCVALAMATTGIAATLLDLGRTYHSRLKAPLEVHKDSMLQIPAQSSLAQLIRMATFLLLDEATMLDGLQLEATHRSLQDICDAPGVPFGGKTLVLAGDFRQCLPVIPGANRAGIVSHSINQSHLWSHFKQFKLSTNMRVRASGDRELQKFDEWSLSVGNGEMDVLDIPESMIATRIIPNSKENPNAEGTSMKQFCQKIFPNIETNIKVPRWLDGRAILATTNKEVKTLNDVVCDMLPGNVTVIKSSDELDNSQDVLRFNKEYLNSLNPSGFPPHILHLKKHMPLMLLRNLQPKEGLCNGTKMIFLECIDNKVLKCKLQNDKEVLIPRIVFIPKPKEYPFEWRRRMFPVKPAFAMTINKAQGQTLKYAGNLHTIYATVSIQFYLTGIWLRSQVFTHGQMYVAISRVGNPNNLKFAIMKKKGGGLEEVKNVVYKEVLLNDH